MAWLAAAGPYIAAAGTVVSAVQQNQAASVNAANARMQAEQMERQGMAEQAVSQRDAERARREARFLESRATALAASGGGSASDPTVVNLIGGIQDEGEYNALTALYNGNQRAASLNSGAQQSVSEARQFKRAGVMQSAGTLLQGAATIGRYA